MVESGVVTPRVPPLRIGPHQIWPPIVLAPMSGVTNRTLRALYKPFGFGLTVTEFVSSNALQHGSKTLMSSRIVDAIVTFLNVGGGDAT